MGGRNYTAVRIISYRTIVREIHTKLRRIVYFLPFAFIVALFLVVPFLNMIRKSFLCDNGAFGLGQYIEIFTKQIYLTAIRNSVRIAIWSTLVGLTIDFLAAIAIDRLLTRKRRWYLSLLNITSTFAGLPLTMSFITILGTSGVFVLLSRNLGFTPIADYNLYSLKGMYIIFLYFQIPMGTLLIVPGMEKVKKEWKEAAVLMNCSTIRFWVRIGIPVMMPTLMGTLGMLFTNALTAYTTPYLLTGNSIAFLPIKISDMFVGDIRQRPELGSALSIVMLLIILLVLGITNVVKHHFESGVRS